MKYIPRLRFSLRTLLLVTVVVAILAGEFTRRLWRFQERRAALATLATYGFRFTKDASQIKPTERDPRGVPPFDRLDALLFGDEVHVGYYKAEFNIKEFFAALATKPLPEFEKLLHHFPEIEVLFVDESRGQYPWVPTVLESVRQLLASVAARPHLIRFHLNELPAKLGSDWMMKIPAQNRLRFFNWTAEDLPPETVSVLMQRAPAINNIRVGLSDLNEDLVRRWNQNPSWQFDEQGKAVGEFSTILVVSPENVRNVEQCLNKIQVNFHVCLNDNEQKYPDFSFELDGSGISSLIYGDFQRVKLVNLPHCIYVMLGNTDDVQMENCPKISKQNRQEIQERIDQRARAKRPGRRQSLPDRSP